MLLFNIHIINRPVTLINIICSIIVLVVTVVKSTMETSMSSGLSASLIEVMGSNPVGKKQSKILIMD